MYSDEKLRDLLYAVELPPTAVDVERAVMAGRRRRWQSRTMAGAAAMLVIASGTTYFAFSRTNADPGPPKQNWPALAAPLADCTVDVLDAASGVAGKPLLHSPVVNPTGRTTAVTVGTIDTTGIASKKSTTMRLEEGRMEPYPGLPGIAVAINASGLVVGVEPGQAAALGFTYRDGSKSMLAKLDGYESTMVSAVNVRGDVVGLASTLDGSVPVVWPADKPGTVQALAVPEGFGVEGLNSSDAVGVADDGTVVGNANARPIRWAPDGTPNALPVSAAYSQFRVDELKGRYAYGTAWNENHDGAVIRWNLDNDEMKVFDTGSIRRRSPIAGQQWVFVPSTLDGTADGWSITSIGEDTPQPVRITPDGQLERLPLPQGKGATATAVNDDGSTIVGLTAHGPGPEAKVVIWHC